MKEERTLRLSKRAIPCLLELIIVGALAPPSGAQEQSESQKASSLSASDSPADAKEKR